MDTWKQLWVGPVYAKASINLLLVSFMNYKVKTRTKGVNESVKV